MPKKKTLCGHTRLFAYKQRAASAEITFFWAGEDDTLKRHRHIHASDARYAKIFVRYHTCLVNTVGRPKAITRVQLAA